MTEVTVDEGPLGETEEPYPLPEGWVWTTLGKLAYRITSGSRGWAKYYSDQGDLFIRVGNFNRLTTELDLNDSVFVKAPHDAEADRTRVEPNDILLTITADVGMVGIVDPRIIASRNVYINQHVALIKLRDLRAASFIGYALASNIVQKQIEKRQYGAIKTGLSLSDVRDLKLPLAPLPEQRRIVAKIEELLTSLDAGVAGLKRIQAALKRYRAAVLKAACEGRLVPQDPNDEPAEKLLERILAERRAKWEADLRTKGKDPAKAKYEEPKGPETEGLPELPKEWCWATLGSLIADGPTNGLYLPKERYGSGVPILRIDDFQSNFSRSSTQLRQVTATADEQQKFSLHENDVVINRVNSPTHLGKSMVVQPRNLPAVYESNMMRLAFSTYINPQYVEMYLQSSNGRTRLIRNAKWAVNQASINQQDVQATEMPLPTAAEQHRIVAEVERRLSVVSELGKLVETNLMRAERLRQAILRRAFKGKLVGQE